jgi:hypothetical protein
MGKLERLIHIHAWPGCEAFRADRLGYDSWARRWIAWAEEDNTVKVWDMTSLGKKPEE